MLTLLSLSLPSPPPSLSPCHSVYDDTLLHQHPEPVVVNHKPATKQNSEKKVVHRRMSLPDPKPNGPGSGEADDEAKDDRRASTGDFSVPIVTSVSPGVDSVTEGVCMHVCHNIMGTNCM